MKRKGKKSGRAGGGEASGNEAAVIEAPPEAPPEPPPAPVEPPEELSASEEPDVESVEPEPLPATEAYDPPIDPLNDFFVGDRERADLGESYVGEIVDTAGQRAVVQELLAFWCADEQYGIDISEIQEIIKVPYITDVPRAPSSVLGVISLRGVIVPIVDLREVLRLEKRELGRDNRIIVLRADGDPVGLLVDRVTHVVRIDAESIEPPPAMGGLSRADLVTGVGRTGDQILIVLDARALWAVMEQAA
jgi:purine-binding chemotaxis protein CheW